MALQKLSLTLTLTLALSLTYVTCTALTCIDEDSTSDVFLTDSSTGDADTGTARYVIVDDDCAGEVEPTFTQRYGITSSDGSTTVSKRVTRRRAVRSTIQHITN